MKKIKTLAVLCLYLVFYPHLNDYRLALYILQQLRNLEYLHAQRSLTPLVTMNFSLPINFRSLFAMLIASKLRILHP
jgi:hypothetical protein